MHCLKTGFTAYLESYDIYVHGDAFIVDDTPGQISPYGDDPVALGSHHLLLRVCWTGDTTEGVGSRIHLKVGRVEHWFDERVKDMQKQNSTILVRPRAWSWLGYQGQTA